METLTVYAHEVAEVFRICRSLKVERDDLRKKYEDAIRMFNESDLDRVNLRNENAALFTKYENASGNADEYRRLYEETKAKLETAIAVRDEFEKILDEKQFRDIQNFKR